VSVVSLPAMKTLLAATILSLLSLLIPSVAVALEPQEVLVIANRKFFSGSEDVARHYCRARHVPEKTNLLLLDLPNTEECSRKEFLRAASVVRKRLATPEGRKVRCLLTVYGVPLKIARDTDYEAKVKADITTQKARVEKPMEGLPRNPSRQVSKKLAELRNAMRMLEARSVAIDRLGTASAFDSELALVRVEAYPLEGWLRNPLLGMDSLPQDLPGGMLMVARLDAPTPELAKGLVDKAIAAERSGLKGTAYLDARGMDPGKAKNDSYARYDQSIRNAAERLKEAGVKVVLDNKADLFPENKSCPDAALYCGWYSLGKYQDSFAWATGAVGYHIASSECATLKRPERQVWCKRMLEEGITATLGPVMEPYLEAFPKPDDFLPRLIQGRLTIAECYWLTVPHLSWRMVLIGDPLYRVRMGK